jgi:hypothetical protein
MRRSTLITATLMALALAPTLGAQSRGPRGAYGTPHGYGYGYGDERYGDQRHGGRVGYPDVARMERVSELAHQIDETASWIHRQFERNNRRPDWAESRAASQLHELHGAAARFHDVSESYRPTPRRTVDEFARLVQAFYATDRSLSRISRRPYVDRGMERIYVLMNELGRYYGQPGYGRWGSPLDRGAGRYDRDGHGGRYGDQGTYDGRYDDGRYDDGYVDDSGYDRRDGAYDPPPYRR